MLLARRHRADPHVVRAAAPHCSALVPQSSVPQLGSTGVAGTLGHGTKIRYISFPDVHNLYSSLPEPKLLDHGTKIRYISVPEVPTRYRTKKYLLGTKFFVANRIKLWRIDIRYLVARKRRRRNILFSEMVGLPVRGIDMGTQSTSSQQYEKNSGI